MSEFVSIPSQNNMQQASLGFRAESTSAVQWHVTEERLAGEKKMRGELLYRHSIPFFH